MNLREQPEPAVVRATPFRWVEPSTLEPIGMNDPAIALEEVDPQIWEWVRQAVVARDALSAPVAEPPKAANDNTPVMRTVDPADWQDTPIPDREWYAADLIPMRAVTLLTGDGGTGKSLLAMQVGIAGALSVECLGFTTREGRVFYLACEDDDDELHRRSASIVEALGRRLDQLRGRFRIAPMAGKDAILAAPDARTKRLNPTPVLQALIDEVASFRPALLILDTSADLFGGNEIDRAQVRQFIGMLRQIALDLDCAIMLLSHPSVAGMASGSGLSGSTAWNNSVRSRLYLTADKDDADLRALTTVKTNYAGKGAEMRLRWRDGTFILDDGKPTPAASIMHRHHDEKFRELLSDINRGGQRVAPTKGVNYAPNIMATHPDAIGVTKKQLEASMQRLLAAGLIKVVMDGPPSKQRQRLIVSAEDYGPGGVLDS